MRILYECKICLKRFEVLGDEGPTDWPNSPAEALEAAEEILHKCEKGWQGKCVPIGVRR